VGVLPDAVGSSPLPFRARRSTQSSDEGEEPAPLFPPMEEHAGLRVARRRTDAHAGGSQAAHLCRCLMAAVWPLCTSTSPPLTKHGVAATVVEEARECTLHQRAWPPSQDGGRGRASHRIARRRWSSLSLTGTKMVEEGSDDVRFVARV
jgi:hypothetical protein